MDSARRSEFATNNPLDFLGGASINLNVMSDLFDRVSLKAIALPGSRRGYRLGRTGVAESRFRNIAWSWGCRLRAVEAKRKVI
jgi:hypothetical protein